MELLLMSNSTNHGSRRFGHAREELRDFYGDAEVLFVPYALADHDSYTAAVAESFAEAGVRVRGVHTVSDPAAALAEAAGIFVGGGNSFRLLRALQRGGLIEAIRTAVGRGARYGGASAGTNMACPTLRTTNDMPIVEPMGFATLGLIDFQINPHYQDPIPDSSHMGESRQQRIAEFLEENDVPVLGLREGAWLRVSDDSIVLRGHTARLFRRDVPPEEWGVDADLSFLTGSARRFDNPAAS
ncbi:dipeptidase PepE [Actinoalloteichus hymeniacidonis]|uniref:Peptidase E n=1 Tax=Actinoalloteichus hymeniacidonis TaxID=340345 RepID=A0AAC9HS34_9PSEU|nr:dipeptidase PepE [Actinoalloteichus hymeniacidonis]AOS63936.1 peptidase E [Actinoalloteichus hymeniacidonis]MBB5908007.1 dipeptidase E [Actinoalloteichus hymeniacidonis]